MKHSIILTVLIHSSFVFAEDTLSIFDQKLDQLRLELGMNENAEFDQVAFNLLIKKIDSLKIKDHQLEDGYDWGGGRIGFDVYLKNNIDRILSELGHSSPKFSNVKKDTISVQSQKNTKMQNESITQEVKVGPVTDLVVIKSSKKNDRSRVKKSNIKDNNKSFLSGLRIGSGLGKPLVKGSSFSDHASFFESMLSIRSPIGIGIGPVLVSLGFESSKYSFEATVDTSTSYFGSGAGPILFFDLSKVIKIGGDKLGKYFMFGSANYDHGSGFVTGYDLNVFIGSLPISFSVSSRANTISLQNGGTSYWVSGYAGVGIDIR